MLGNGERKDEALPPATVRLRDLLARGLAAANPGLDPLKFDDAVHTFSSALISARLVEAAGLLPGETVADRLAGEGVHGGMGSIVHPLVRDEGPGGWPGISRFRDLKFAGKVSSGVSDLLYSRDFSGEWSGPGEAHERTGLQYVTQVPVLSDSGEIYRMPGDTGPALFPPSVVRDMIEEPLHGLLKGKNPHTLNIAILDPVCGTGRVLCCLLSGLIRWHSLYYRDHLVPLLEEGRDPSSRAVQAKVPAKVLLPDSSPGRFLGIRPMPVRQGPGGEWELSWAERIRILGTCLYGLGPDRASTEFTRLSLLCNLLRYTVDPGEDRDSLPLLFSVLGSRVACSNFLQGPDYIPPDTRQGYRPAYDRDIPVEERFLEVCTAGGFSLVTGVFSSSLHSTESGIGEYLCRRYRHITHGDSTPCFLERGISVIRPGGEVSGIFRGDWQRSPGAARFREWLSAYQVEKITRLKAFSAMTGMRDPQWIRIRNAPSSLPVMVGDVVEPSPGYTGEYRVANLRFIEPGHLCGKPWDLRGITPAEVVEKITAAGTPLERVVFFDSVVSGPLVPPPLLISRQEYLLVRRKDPVARAWLYPYIGAAEIGRYRPQTITRYAVRIPEGTTRNLSGDPEGTWEWFRDHHHTLAGIMVKGTTEPTRGDNLGELWWEWGGRPWARFLAGPLLLTIPGSGSPFIPWTFLGEGALPAEGVLAIGCRDIALAGILNSSLFRFYLGSFSGKAGKRVVSPERILGFPVPLPDPDLPDPEGKWEALARDVRARYGHTRDSSLDQEIDRRVYDLYGLSPAEITCITNYLPGIPGTREISKRYARHPGEAG